MTAVLTSQATTWADVAAAAVLLAGVAVALLHGRLR